MTANARHGKATPRWGTDVETIEVARRCMGSIDTDPCSEAFFQQFVKAERYYSLTERGEDGLQLPWPGNNLCNHPGGLTRAFWHKALDEYISSVARQIIWVGFAMGQLNILADEQVHPSDFSICYLRDRIPFIEPPDLQAERVARLAKKRGVPESDVDTKSAPSHTNYVTGIGVSREAFEREFGPLGKVQHGPLALPPGISLEARAA